MHMPQLESLKAGHDKKMEARNPPMVAALPPGQGRKTMQFGSLHQLSVQQQAPVVSQVTGSGRTPLRPPECPHGTIFFQCPNGFHGCASSNPCMGSGNMVTPALIPVASTAQIEHTPVETSAAVPDAPLRLTIEDQPATPTNTVIAVATSSHLAFTTTSKTGSPSDTNSVTENVLAKQAYVPAPSCPEGHNTIYEDPSSVTYRIHCNTDNTAMSFHMVQVGIGGYSQCFSSCSSDNACTGFAFVGAGSGNCYLKSNMPNISYIPTVNPSYISCVKLQHEDTVVPQQSLPVQEQVSSAHGKTLGGYLFALIVVGFVMSFLAVRLRRDRGIRLGPGSPRVNYGVPGLMEAFEKDRSTFTLPEYSLEDPDVSPFGYTDHYSVYAPAYDSTATQVQPPPGARHARQRSIYKDRSEQ